MDEIKPITWKYRKHKGEEVWWDEEFQYQVHLDPQGYQPFWGYIDQGFPAQLGDRGFDTPSEAKAFCEGHHHRHQLHLKHHGN